MPKDINPAEIMLNNLTEKSESLTGHNPLDIRRLSTYFIFDFTENPEVNERLKLRVSTDHVKKNLNDIDQIFFPIGTKINIGIITNDTSIVEQVVQKFTKRGEQFRAENGQYFSGFCTLTIFLIQTGKASAVIQQGKNTIQFVKRNYSNYSPTITIVGVRKPENDPVAKTVDEILFWLINTRKFPVDFDDADGKKHHNFFIPAAENKECFIQIKVLMNAYTEFSILSTLNKEFKTTQAEEFNLTEDSERTSFQKAAYFEKLHLQEDQLDELLNRCKEFVPIEYQVKEKHYFVNKKHLIFFNRSEEKVTSAVVFNEDNEKLKSIIAEYALRLIPANEFYHYIFNTLSDVYIHVDTIRDDQWNGLYQYVGSCIDSFFKNAPYIGTAYKEKLNLEETKIQYKSFVEKYMLFNRSIAARLLYWSGIHSIHYDGVAPLNTNIPFLSKKLEYDFPEAEFNAAIKSVTREELTPSNHLATDGLAFYDALPSENARVTMQNKEFFVMKHEITLEEGDV
ncbi:MAG TPA: hypothetical protein OIM05_00065 [Oscillospiraceae bacterium]|jgi:hypothetical protein|uniref:hypothetical protein n=1 Tax=Ruminococcus callidus TaxID=40519 RepID=UPI002599109C|nr:hypothetical protein [uncultured Ruminococcus sp.]HJH91379.1 hypothetical protein [Oscillospiraceae bacterium]